MRKNFTLLFLMGIFSLFCVNAQAQQDSTIDPADIRFWIGEGENQAILAVNWAEPDTCLAWGFRFGSDPTTLKEMMAAIADADYRFSFDAPANFVNDIKFNDGFLDLGITEYGYFMYNVNGEMSMEYYDTQIIVDGDLVKWGDTNCGTIIDLENWVYVWEAPVVPVYPLAEEAMIDPEEIVYWVGEGDHAMVFAVNWADPDTCLAWGYRFSSDEVILKEVMDAIAEKDSRFAYSADGSFLTDITFDVNGIHLGLVGMYWMYNLNGSMAWYGFDEQPIQDGDFVKWGDESCGTEIAPWTLVWETPVTPVSNNTLVIENATTLSLYPNPASAFSMLSIEKMSGNAMVTVSDLQGRILNSFAVNTTADPVRIETANYVPGLYFVTVEDANSRQTVKLSVK